MATVKIGWVERTISPFDQDADLFTSKYMHSSAPLSPFIKYLAAYPYHLIEQVKVLSQQGQLQSILQKKYPSAHDIRTDKALYQFVQDLKNFFMRNSEPICKVIFDSQLHVIHHALGTHTTISRVQGRRLKSRKEIRIASVFKSLPPEFLHMIVVHELAHLKIRQHNKAFYQLCAYMLFDYHQIEFDLRCWLAQQDLISNSRSP